MARISDLACLIDGLALDARSIPISQREDAEQRSRDDFSCSDGHIWRFDGDEKTLMIYRRQ